MPSFNVQDAVSLTISEGEVHTIHDADGQQLWGAVGYTTKYQGDTEQTTYTGKNLFNKNATPVSGLTQNTVTVLDSGIRVITTTGGTFKYVEYVIGDISAYVGNYLLTTATITPSAENAGRIQLGLCKSDGTDKVSKSALSASGTVSFTIRESDVAERPYLYLYAYSNLNGTAVADDYVDYTDFQLEVSSSTTATTYEPYVGGIPSPNPDYPQPISVVTGTQTVTLTGGTVSEDYTVHLGTLELAKIGTYQDYIYKSSSNWYVHKAVGKETFVGASGALEPWQQSANLNYFYISVPTASTTDSSSIVGAVISNYYTPASQADMLAGSVDYGVGLHSTTPRIVIRNKNYTSDADFKTWLSTHNTTVYFALGTATDTQITDTDLVAELDAIEEFMTRYGYTATVAGSLPIIINQTELS